MKVFIHIGHIKTGTTSIQSFLDNNHYILKNNGVLYPKTGLISYAHYSLVQPLENYDWNIVKPLMINLQKEISESNCHTVVLSSECFIFNGYNFTLFLKQFFHNFDVSIIYYVRSSLELIQSSFLHGLKKSKEESTYAERIFPAYSFFQYNHDTFNINNRITAWEKVFSNSTIKASLYHPEIIDLDVRHHFLKQIGITDPDLIAKLNFGSEWANQSIHPLLSDLITKIDQSDMFLNAPEVISQIPSRGSLLWRGLRKAKRIILSQIKQDTQKNDLSKPITRQEIIAELLKLSQKIKHIKHSLFTPEQEEEIKQYYAESNASFADKYLTPREKELLCGVDNHNTNTNENINTQQA